MGEPISLGKATSLQPSPVKTAPGRPREPAGRGPADTADRSDSGGRPSGSGPGRRRRQRHEEVPAVGDEIAGKELAGEAVAVPHD